jgi:DNA-binding IclR family transcriptional regulator
VARPSVSDVGVLDKIVDVLDRLAEADGPRTLAQLSAATGHHRATVHRLLHALNVHGLTRVDESVGWSLGPRLAELGRIAMAGLPLRDAAMPALERLRDTTGESVQLFVRDGDRRVCVASLESPHGLRTIVALGAVLPLDRGSAGKVLLDDAPRSRRGWVESVAEREAGVSSVSAAVRDHDGTVRAAVSVSGPVERTTRAPGRRYGADVVSAARQVEMAVGWRSPDQL